MLKVGLDSGAINNINFSFSNCRTVKINEVGLIISAGVTVTVANSSTGLTVTTATIFLASNFN